MTFSALLMLLLLAACASYTYVDAVKSGERLDKPLYSVVVPPVAMGKESLAYGVEWSRYSKDGVPDDLVMNEGYAYSSYAAVVEVKRSSQRLQTIDDLKHYVSAELALSNPIEFSSSQEQLMCVVPDMHIDAAPERSHGFFMRLMACMDKTTHHYYELRLSYMTRRKGDQPPKALSVGADQFFRSFTIR